MPMPPRTSPQVAIVVPTIRPFSINRFLEKWDFRSRGVSVYVVEDNPQITFRIDEGTVDSHVSWLEVEQHLGENAWIIPRRTDCIRSYGFLLAAQCGADVIISMDDDCLPTDDYPPATFVRQHVMALRRTWPSWESSILCSVNARGHPYNTEDILRTTLINVGGWTGVPDLSAVSQLVFPKLSHQMHTMAPVPLGTYFPMCGMNLAFAVEALPMMYFLLMGRTGGLDRHPFDRSGDIWCGLIAKRICDHLRRFVTAGTPLVNHSKASNVWSNLEKETPGLQVNEYFWQIIDGISLTATTVAGCYEEIARRLSIGITDSHECVNAYNEYWKHLGKAMLIWLEEIGK